MLHGDVSSHDLHSHSFGIQWDETFLITRLSSIIDLTLPFLTKGWLNVERRQNVSGSLHLPRRFRTFPDYV